MDIETLMRMQRELYEKHRDTWDPLQPEYARNSLLWLVEEVGYYNPLTEPVELKINEERAKYWLGVGAQPTDTVRGLLKKGGVL